MGTVSELEDGGQNWIGQLSGTTLQLRGVDFIDSDNEYAVGGLGTILMTTTKTNWISQSSGTASSL